MPMIHIWLHEGKDADFKGKVSQAIHDGMVEVFGVPHDTWDHVINELKPGHMIYDPNFSGVPRSQDMIFVHFFLNSRSKEVKHRFFDAVADLITGRTGLRREDLMMVISEVPAENWWAVGRQVDPNTGFDVRTRSS